MNTDLMILRDDDRIVTRWKNGGGLTRNVAVFPEGSSLSDFEWRVSIADVEVPGPFSSFDNVDRVLTVLHGILRLDTEVGTPVELVPLAPYRFAGDIAMEGAPVHGPVRDLNVMVRRTKWRAAVKVHQGGDSVETEADTVMLVAIQSQRVALDGAFHELGALDAMIVRGKDRDSVHLGGIGVVIEFWRQND